MSKRELTKFQIQMRDLIEPMLSLCGSHFLFEAQGESEVFLYGRIEAHDLEIWIYLDEAELKCDGRQFLCERESYASLDNLFDDFENEVRRIVGGLTKVLPAR